MKRDRKKSARRWSASVRKIREDYVAILLIICAGLASTAGIGWLYQSIWHSNNIIRFEQVSRDRIEVIRAALEMNETVLRSVAGLYISSDNVNVNEFRSFVSQVMHDHHFIHALEWLPRTTSQDIKSRVQNCAPGFVLQERNKKGVLVAAAAREEYYPVCYAEPYEHNKMSIGFDFSSDPTRALAMRQAVIQRRITASGRIELVQKMDSARAQTGIAFMLPLFRAEEPRQPEGILASIVPLSYLIEFAIKPLNYAGVNLIVHDLSAKGEKQRLLYVRSTRLREISEAEILEDYMDNKALRLMDTLDVGGRKWQITVLPARGYFQEKIQLATYFIIISGLLFTLLLGFHMYRRLRENETIARQVDDRTHELAVAKKKTEMILLSTKEGIIGLDAGGYITFCNPMAEMLLGYAPGELIGKSYGIFSSMPEHDNDEDPAGAPIRRVVEAGEPCTVSDEFFYRKDGQTIEVEYSGSPLIEEGGIVGAVLVFRDISERKEMARQLEKMARYDQLTGLPNRALFMESLRSALARARRANKKVGVVFMDLNGFKPVNDTLGHAAGDTLLKMFAERIMRVVRDTDMAARLGGDEFTLLVDNISDVSEALILTERIRQALSKPFEIARRPFWITVSMGIALYPDHASSLDELVRYADHAMYKAKKEKTADCIIYSQALEKAN